MPLNQIKKFQNLFIVGDKSSLALEKDSFLKKLLSC